MVWYLTNRIRTADVIGRVEVKVFPTMTSRNDPLHSKSTTVMAPSSCRLCTTCLRAVRGGLSKGSTTKTAQSPRAYSKTTATLRPLYPDVLAPSTASKKGRLQSTSAGKLHISALTQAHQTLRRTLATTAAPSSPSTTATPAHPIQNPRTDDSGTPMTISIAPRASQRLHTIATKDANPSLALRISIESGGCHGFQYLMDLCDLSVTPAGEEDTVFEGVKGEKIVVDEASLELLNGSTVDYTMELIGSQFKITGIPGATSSCGCGTSFDIKF